MKRMKEWKAKMKLMMQLKMLVMLPLVMINPNKEHNVLSLLMMNCLVSRSVTFHSTQMSLFGR